MTGPFPGQGDIPQPWDGHPPPEYGYSGHGGRDTVEPPWHDEPAEPEYIPPERGPRRLKAALVIAIVVVIGGGVTLWYLAAGPDRGDPRHQVAASHSRPPSSSSLRTTSATPNIASAYDIGSCFNEAPGSTSGKVELNPVDCGSANAVFVINRVVDSVPECDAGADFKNHGYEVPDESANVAYCASLVVPANVCFILAAAQPIERTPCGDAPGTVKVLAIESAPSAATACTDKQRPDVWFYQSPTSGQYACVSRPAATSATPTTG